MGSSSKHRDESGSSSPDPVVSKTSKKRKRKSKDKTKKSKTKKTRSKTKKSKKPKSKKSKKSKAKKSKSKAKKGGRSKMPYAWPSGSGTVSSAPSVSSFEVSDSDSSFVAAVKEAYDGNKEHYGP